MVDRRITYWKRRNSCLNEAHVTTFVVAGESMTLGCL